MKIDDLSLSTANTAATQAVRPLTETASTAGAARSAGASEAAAASDSATVSAGASQLATGSDVRMEKVTSVQQALDAGTYQVSAGDVADSLIAAMLQKS